jgi:hypothetical protein
LDIGLQAAERFLAALSPDRVHTFQTFDDAKRGRKGLSRILHGTFAALSEHLTKLNAQGAGVFVMVNRGDGRGRTADNVTGVRALFVDLDGSPIEPVLTAPIPPRIVIESSPGKWHAYWPAGNIPAGMFTVAQKALAARWAGDPKVCDRPRVMRLPGFLHLKAEPFETQLVKCEADPLTWEELADAFALPRHMTLPHTINEGARNNTLYKLARSAAAKGIPENCQVLKALQVNAKRCDPPLPELEVRTAVSNAYGASQVGVVAFPLAVLDSYAYKTLDDSGRQLLLLAYRRADRFNGGCVTLPWSEMVEWFPRKNTFLKVRARVVKSGLLTVAMPPTKRMPRQGRGPQPTFYQLAIGPFSATYSQRE